MVARRRRWPHALGNGTYSSTGSSVRSASTTHTPIGHAATSSVEWPGRASTLKPSAQPPPPPGRAHSTVRLKV